MAKGKYWFEIGAVSNHVQWVVFSRHCLLTIHVPLGSRRGEASGERASILVDILSPDASPLHILCKIPWIWFGIVMIQARGGT
jgi:hypothetical protein